MESRIAYIFCSCEAYHDSRIVPHWERIGIRLPRVLYFSDHHRAHPPIQLVTHETGHQSAVAKALAAVNWLDLSHLSGTASPWLFLGDDDTWVNHDLLDRIAAEAPADAAIIGHIYTANGDLPPHAFGGCGRLIRSDCASRLAAAWCRHADRIRSPWSDVTLSAAADLAGLRSLHDDRFARHDPRPTGLSNIASAHMDGVVWEV